MSVDEAIAGALGGLDPFTAASARRVVAALEADGYAIVPFEPSAEMLASVDDEDSDKYVARGRAYSAWKAMIANRITKGKPMKDSELIRKLLELAGDQDIPEEYRDIALAGLNRIEALRSKLSQYEQPDPDA